MKLFSFRLIKLPLFSTKPTTLAITSALLFVGCTTAMKSPDGAIAARTRLVQLQNDSALAQQAPVAIRTADAAVTQAEVPLKDKEYSNHLVFIAGRQVDIAWAQAETRFLEGQREGLSSQRDSERLDARTREADNAREDKEKALSDSDDLRRQIAELNAKQTERGLVVTLGDILFESGKSQLKVNSTERLYKLTSFLKTYPDRTLMIEGHTDNVGGDESNIVLSQKRAESVRIFLLEQGVNNARLSAIGKGESFPVASNESDSGRALNRRVEVIIANSGINSSTLGSTTRVHNNMESNE